METEKIVFDHVRKEFPGVVALKDVSFSVKKRRSTCVTGRKWSREIDAAEHSPWSIHRYIRKNIAGWTACKLYITL